MVNRLKKIRMVRIAFILWSIAVMTAIFLFSAQPGETSGALSGGLLQMLLDWLRISSSAEQNYFTCCCESLPTFLFMPCWVLA